MSLLSRRSKFTNKAARRKRPLLRPDFELLEDRRLLAPFFVTNNTDGGPGSLRQAILDTNNNPGADSIDFNISVGAISEIAVPTAGSRPLRIVTGPDGNLWFTEEVASKVGRITPAGIITEFSTLTAGSGAEGIAAGPDGNLWFTELHAGKIGRITPAGNITEFLIPTANSGPADITVGPDGNLWFTEQSGDKIGQITTAGTITEFSTPASSEPRGITTGPDGNLWFTESTAGKIGRITTAGTVTEFAVPTASGRLSDITAGPDGNLWFAELDAGNIDRITTAGIVTKFAIPTAGSFPEGITTGPDGNLWFTESFGNKIGQITTAGTITEFSTPTVNSAPLGITTGPDGNLWFTEGDPANKIGRLNLSTALTISPASPLPTITDPVIIDGTTQPGFAGKPIVEIDGSRAGAVDGLWITAGNSTVRGLVINRFAEDGILLDTGGGDLIEGNFIGTDVTGTRKLSNLRNGISVFGSANNTVGGTTASAGNVISGNSAYGISFGTSNGVGASGNIVQGNYIGTDITGTQNLGNSIDGIQVFQSQDNTIGGRIPGARNIISGNNGSGVNINSNAMGNLVLGNFLGTNASGTQALGNAGGGVIIAPNNTVGGTAPGAGNVISGNTGDGLEVNGSDATGTVVQGNFIGLNAAGTAIVGNTGEGLLVNDASGALIGGTAAAARNVISGNGVDGISLNNAGATGNLVQGNYIGTDASGTTALGNARHGVSITHDNNSTNPSGFDNTIGGTVAGAGNLISGNGAFGVVIFGPNGGASGNLLQGNFIGTDVTGTQAVGNVGDGVVLSSAPDNTVGGTTAAVRNVISGNGKYGVVIESSPSTGNLVQGNFIGTDVSGTSPLGNANHGVIIQVGASANMIGGTAAGSGNVIAFNTSDGVTVVSGTGNAILSNAIFANGGLGIDLGTDGVTPNDSLGHNGPNNYQNFPILTAVVTSGGTTTLSGTLNSTPNATFTVQFFANAAPDPSGFGEGQQYLGQTGVTTDGSGNASFSVTLSTPPLVGQFFTTTATDPAGNTSEFSQDISSGTTVTNTNDSGPDSLRQAILNANANPGLDKITFDISGAGVHTISPASALPAITDPVVIDGYTQPGASPNTLANGDNGVLLIELDGSNAGASVDGLVIAVGGSTVRGLVINRFVNGAINIVSDNNAIEGNFIGTDPSGTVALGILTGVTIDRGSGNTVGGTTPAARNLISGNSLVMPGLGRGVRILEGSSNVIAGNYIGTDAAGTRALPNSDVGVLLDGVSTDNTIGGTTTGARNVISGNGTNGVEIINAGSTRNLVAGNYIGIDADGSTALGNGTNGVLLDAAAGNTVGGTGTAANTIGGNNFGIEITGSGATGNVVLGNFIGTNAAGATGLGNAIVGVDIASGASGNTIGGTASGAGNVIATTSLALTCMRPARRATWCKATSSGPTPPAPPGWEMPTSAWISPPAPRATRSAARRAAPVTSSRATAVPARTVPA